MIATGLAGGSTGTRIVEALNDEAILNGFVRIREESRTNTAVLDPTTGLHTEINERGPAVSSMELELFREKLLYLAKGASICVFAGTLPRAMDPDVYSGLIREVRRLGVITMIDTEGEPLRLAMKAEPDVVSPNELEGEELVGHEFNDVADRAQAVADMTRLGAAEAIMTVPDGCYAQVLDGGGSSVYRVRVQEQEARSSIGSGDAFLAGYVAARYSGRPTVDCLRFGVACGAESTQHFGAGIIDPTRVDKLLSEVHAERLRAPRRDPLSAERRAGRGARAPTATASITGTMVAAFVRRSESSAGLLRSRPRRVLRCRNGSRNRTWKEGPPGVWVRRHCDRPLPANEGS